MKIQKSLNLNLTFRAKIIHFYQVWKIEFWPKKQTRNYFIPESWKWRPTPSGKRIRVSSWLKCEWQGSMKFDCLFIHFCTTDMKEEGLLGGCGRIAEPAFYEKKAPHIFDWNMLSILCLAILGTLLNFRAWKYN